MNAGKANVGGKNPTGIQLSDLYGAQTGQGAPAGSNLMGTGAKQGLAQMLGNPQPQPQAGPLMGISPDMLQMIQAQQMGA